MYSDKLRVVDIRSRAAVQVRTVRTVVVVQAGSPVLMHRGAWCDESAPFMLLCHDGTAVTAEPSATTGAITTSSATSIAATAVTAATVSIAAITIAVPTSAVALAASRSIHRLDSRLRRCCRSVQLLCIVACMGTGQCGAGWVRAWPESSVLGAVQLTDDRSALPSHLPRQRSV